MNVFVGKLGDVTGVRFLSGAPMLAPAATDAAKQWTFKPLLVGTGAVPYQVKLIFKFQIIGEMRGFETVKGDLAP